MNTPVISAETANRLNRLVQTQIDSRLFLFCNYEPTHSYTISEDAQFLTAVQDLYKFAIDSSGILQYYYRYVPKADQYQFKPLSGILDKIKALRSVIDHNQSAANGMVEQNLIQICATWVERVLGKSEPNMMQDFTILTAELTQMGKDLVQFAENWIVYIGQKADKSNDVEQWKKRTLQWYCNNSKTEIYRGQLMVAYLDRTAAVNHSINIGIYRLQKKVNMWIGDACFFPLSKAIEELTNSINKFEKMLMNKAVCAQLSVDQQQAVRQQVAEWRQQLETKNQAMSDLQADTNGKPVAYFYRNLESQLWNTISTLEANHVNYTLLPQDLLQEDIWMFFGNVPSPDGDF